MNEAVYLLATLLDCLIQCGDLVVSLILQLLQRCIVGALVLSQVSVIVHRLTSLARQETISNIPHAPPLHILPHQSWLGIQLLGWPCNRQSPEQPLHWPASVSLPCLISCQYSLSGDDWPAPHNNAEQWLYSIVVMFVGVVLTVTCSPDHVSRFLLSGSQSLDAWCVNASSRHADN